MTTDASEKPLPFRTSWNTAFWEATKQHQFLIERCAKCETPRFPPKPLCSKCWSGETTLVPAAGTGTVYTYTILHRAGLPAFQAEVPYAIVLVELDEGVKAMSNLVHCELDQVHIGMPVRMVWEDGDDLALYKFEPA